jgi:PAS domain S-box-containing protein
VRSLSKQAEHVLQSPDVRILSVMIAGIALFGIADGSLWRALLTPTVAYRPAVLFGLTLVFGWRGFVWSQLLFLISFWTFLGWRGALLVTPLFLISHACALVLARRLARNQPWLLRERSTLAFLAGAALAPAVPAVLNGAVLPLVGIEMRASVPTAVDGWLRGGAAILALVPALLVHLSRPLKKWTALAPSDVSQARVTTRNLVELSIEIAVWTTTLWITVLFKARDGLNITYLTFLPPLAFALIRGMRLTTLALAANALVATTLWYQLHWQQILSALDLRLLITIYSVTILVLAAVVDERKRSRAQVEKLRTGEAVLRESERHFRTLANSAPAMIWMTGPDRQCTFVNKPWLEFTGRPIELELRDGWINSLHPDDVGRCRATFNSAVEARRSFSLECRFRRADGEYRWILDSGAPFYRDGQFAGYVGSCVDVTSQKLAAERLRESEEAARANEERLISIYNTVRDVIFHLAVEPEEQFRFVSVNAAFLSVTGLTREAVVGKTVSEVIPEPSLTMVLEKYRQAIEKHTVVVWEETSDYPTGRLTGEVSVAPVFDNQGTCTHLVGSVHDITEVRRAQQEALARQKLETVGTLANGIAHDFNNILGGVLAQADLALTLVDSHSSVTEELQAIRVAAMRGAEIVRELMIYAGTESPDLMPLDVSAVIEEMIGLLKVSVSKHAKIEMDLAHDLPAVRANPGQISQLLLNLLTNASDAIGDRDGFIRVTTRRIGAAAQLEVSDSGCGMRTDTQSRVFEPFFSTKSVGRGIGLAVVDGIVRSLGGAIMLESEPGKGTTIRISLPAAVADS